MPRIYILFVFLNFFAQNSNSQISGFNYQAVIRSNGLISVNESLELQIDVVDSQDEIQYSETHSVITSPYGQISLLIGNGENKVGDLATIDWSSSQYLIEMYVNGEMLTSSPIVPVPVALYAERSGSDGAWSTVGDSVIYHKILRTGVGNESPSELFVVGDDLGDVTGLTDIRNLIHQIKTITRNTILVLLSGLKHI